MFFICRKFSSFADFLTHNLVPKPVSERYIQEGGPAFLLLQEQNCQLIVDIKITNLNDNDVVYHSVAWDGKVIANIP